MQQKFINKSLIYSFKKKFNAQFIFGIFRQTPLQVLDVSTNHPYGVPSDDGLQIRPKHIEVFHEIYRR